MTPEEAIKLNKDNHDPRLRAAIGLVEAELKYKFKNGSNSIRFSTSDGRLDRDLVKGVMNHYTNLGWHVEVKFIEGYLEFYTHKPEPPKPKKSWWTSWFS